MDSTICRGTLQGQRSPAIQNEWHRRRAALVAEIEAAVSQMQTDLAARGLPVGPPLHPETWRHLGRVVGIADHKITRMKAREIFALALARWDQWFARETARLAARRAARSQRTNCAAPISPAPPRPRRGRPARGSAAGQQKVVAALLAHHGYESGSVLSWEPATLAALAKLAGVSTSTASRVLASIFAADKGEGYERYRAACQSELLAAVLTGLAEPQRLARCIVGADVDADSRRIPRRRR
jgi:hypothetical protein